MTPKHVPASVRGVPVKIRLEPMSKRPEPVDTGLMMSVAIIGFFTLLAALYVMCARLGEINAALAPV